jgi:hypothetical protein
MLPPYHRSGAVAAAPGVSCICVNPLTLTTHSYYQLVSLLVLVSNNFGLLIVYHTIHVLSHLKAHTSTTQQVRGEDPSCYQECLLSSAQHISIEH